MIFGEINSFLDFCIRIKNWFFPRKETVAKVGIETRFIELFKHHGVHRNQIPRFFEHNLKPKDMIDDASVLSVLTEAMLEDASKLFAVNREWLDGESEQIYPVHDFYKWPQDFKKFVDGLGDKGDINLYGVLLVPEEKDVEWANSLLIIQESIGSIGKKTIYRYHLCNNWLFSYWKSRAYLTACIAIAWKNGCCIIGRKDRLDFINQYADGNKFLEYDGEDSLPVHGSNWYPEDMALSPDLFLDGVDPEKDNFGVVSGLELWLKLFDEGYMDTGLDYSGVRQKFENKLLEFKELKAAS